MPAKCRLYTRHPVHLPTCVSRRSNMRSKQHSNSLWRVGVLFPRLGSYTCQCGETTVYMLWPAAGWQGHNEVFMWPLMALTFPGQTVLLSSALRGSCHPSLFPPSCFLLIPVLLFPLPSLLSPQTYTHTRTLTHTDIRSPCLHVWHTDLINKKIIRIKRQNVFKNYFECKVSPFKKCLGLKNCQKYILIIAF